MNTLNFWIVITFVLVNEKLHKAAIEVDTSSITVAYNSSLPSYTDQIIDRGRIHFEVKSLYFMPNRSRKNKVRCGFRRRHGYNKKIT